MLGQFQMRNFASKHESMDKLIGRDKEHAELERCLNSDRSELVIVYGRRRIGKTFLIEEFFDREFDFKYVGAHGMTTRRQLNNFLMKPFMPLKNTCRPCPLTVNGLCS